MLRSMFNTMGISTSGMSAQRTKLNVISENIANAETTRTNEGGPYRRKITVLEEGRGKKFRKIFQENKLKMERTDQAHHPDEPFKKIKEDELNGVHVEEIAEDPTDFKAVYKPNHPDADENGYVMYPNVNIVQEMTEMINATRSFEANVTAFNSTKKMIQSALKI